MRERDRLGPLPGGRRIGLAVPMVLSMAASFAMLSIIAEDRRCGPGCASPLSALPAHLIGPLAVVGCGDAEGHPMVEVVLADVGMAAVG